MTSSSDDMSRRSLSASWDLNLASVSSLGMSVLSQDISVICVTQLTGQVIFGVCPGMLDLYAKYFRCKTLTNMLLDEQVVCDNIHEFSEVISARKTLLRLKNYLYTYLR